jgi:hypothetical protein
MAAVGRVRQQIDSGAADQIALLTAEADRYSRTSMVPAFKSDIRVEAGRKERTLRAAVESLRRYEQLRTAAQRILSRDFAAPCGHGAGQEQPCPACIEALLVAALDGRIS